MQATAQMTQSMKVRRRDLLCAEDKNACFQQLMQYLYSTISSTDEEWPRERNRDFSLLSIGAAFPFGMRCGVLRDRGKLELRFRGKQPGRWREFPMLRKKSF